VGKGEKHCPLQRKGLPGMSKEKGSNLLKKPCKKGGRATEDAGAQMVTVGRKSGGAKHGVIAQRMSSENPQERSLPPTL